ncbi:GNAT family N-acetyltransferase [Paenibacillus ihumii]|uniref:GNAT family N-acetyltransferase n=1 Tax=Paenibacillus ihumii TaxID=687436 RepID=UPI0006D78A95|nr:GNAT family protein [Paenibacillus ihumii]
MSSYQYLPMTGEYASLIASWKYEGQYSFYNLDGSPECLSELMNGDYYSVLDEHEELVGFICTGHSARVPGGYSINIYNRGCLDLGLGLKPQWTGKGRGVHFLTSSLCFVRERFGPFGIQLVVAKFNERAIKVYERVGFKRGQSFISPVGHEDVEFIVMHYSM